jgi:hypothetical protein
MKTSYIPKPIRGQVVKGHIKVSKSQVKRWFQAGQTFSGFIVGNKVNSFHFFGGWHLAFQLEKSTWTEFERTLNEWAWYNANSETGNIPAIYLKRPRDPNYIMSAAIPFLL